MVKPIVKDPLFLARKALPAGVEDAPEALDLLDTLRANRGVCVGMAANMIGGRKNIIAYDTFFRIYQITDYQSRLSFQ